ncbi:putative glucose-6-phosphate 1-epimerase [Spinacia oleracea]|uniref:Glucose-6-phosphate 1-epimerase n=1 Tax=Spinacia oleracea TaxID=3562 RepID=A0A9R0K5C2_SPIOL|nr:putative glucose-6-phosphate 1-epimerase [Spinacia oleracea]
MFQSCDFIYLVLLIYHGVQLNPNITLPFLGGIPIFSLQVEPLGSLGFTKYHGYCTDRVWSTDHSPPPLPVPSTNTPYVDWLLELTEEELEKLPNKCEIRLRVGLGPEGQLVLTFRVKNIDSKPFSFPFACHTYFSVSDISKIRVEGLETSDYIHNTKNNVRLTEQGNPITVEEEIDRVYISTPNKISIIDHQRKKTYVILKQGLPDAVIWNPWDKQKKIKSNVDFRPKDFLPGSYMGFKNTDYKQMLCVGAAAIENPIKLEEGEEWIGRQEISCVYNSGQLDPQRVLMGT